MRDLFGETFSTVRLDPAFPEDGGGRGAQNHYSTIKTFDDLADVVRGCEHLARVAGDAHCYMDATNRFTVAGDYADREPHPWAPRLMRAMGFRPITLLTWAKLELAPPPSPGCTCVRCAAGDLYARGQMGVGQYFRGQTEQIIFGVRGDGMGLRRAHTERRDLGTLIIGSVPRDERGVRIHSRKPRETYEHIEAASPGPYLELFARVRHSPQWTVWGNEAPEAA